MATRTRSERTKQKSGQPVRFAVAALIIITFAVIAGYVSNMMTFNRALALLIAVAFIIVIFVRPFFGVAAFLILTLLRASDSLYSIPSISMNRVIGMILVFSLLASTAQHKKFQFRLVGTQTYLLIAYVYIALFSLMLSPFGFGSLGYEGIKQILISFSIYFLTINLLKNQMELRLTAWVIVACGFISAAYVIVFNPITNSGREMGFYSNPNSLAHVLFYATLFSAFFVLRTKNGLLRAAIFLNISLLIYTIVLTGSRGALISIVAVLAIMVARERKFSFPMATIAILLALFIAIPMASGINKRIHDIPTTFTESEIEDVSARNRVQVDKIAWEMFLDHPVLGVGFGNFLEASKTEYSEYQRVWTNWSHNIIMSTLAQTGVVGLILLLCILYVGFKDFLSGSARFMKAGDSETGWLVWFFGLALIGHFILLLTHGTAIDRMGFLFLAVGAASRNSLHGTERSGFAPTGGRLITDKKETAPAQAGEETRDPRGLKPSPGLISG